MARQHVNFKTSALDPPNAPADDGLDTGDDNAAAIRPVVDGQSGNAAVFKRPSENLRTRSETLRAEVENLKYLTDADRAMLLSSTGNIAWNSGTGAFTLSGSSLTLRPFMAPATSIPSRLIICANTVGQITIRTVRQVGSAPRAYSGANDITIDFQPVTSGTGTIVVTATGSPANNVHVQYDDHTSSGTTVNALVGNSFLTQFNASAVALSLGLEAVVEGGGTPAEVGYPVPPASVAGTFLGHVTNGIQASERLTRYMSGAADAEKHVIPDTHFTTFFGDALNAMAEGDTLCISYDDLVMSPTDGGRRQSISDAPELNTTIPSGNLFLLRRFPARAPLALPICTRANNLLIFINGRTYANGESGTINAGASSYAGSGTWANGVAGITAGTFEAAIDAVVSQLALATGTSGAARIGTTAITGVIAGTVQSSLQGLSDLIVGGGGDVSAHLADTVDAHDASAISATGGTFTEVQAAITSYAAHIGAGGSVHAAATNSVAGFMSAADKTALGAHIGAGGSAHANATTSVAGFMSAADKVAVNAIANNPRNLVINGGFDFWQRGVLSWAYSNTVGAGVYTTRTFLADRWYITGRSNAGTQLVEGLTERVASGLDNTTYCMRISNNVPSLDNATLAVVQEIDRDTVKWLQGKAVSVSVKLRRGPTANEQYTIQLIGSTSVGLTSLAAYASPVLFLNETTIGVLPSTFTTFTATSAVIEPGINCLALLIGYPPHGVGEGDVNDYMDVAEVSLVASTSPATNFELAGGALSGELLLCQQYYEKSYEADTAPLTLGAAPGFALAILGPNVFAPAVSFRARKARVPTADFPVTDDIKVYKISATAGTGGQAEIMHNGAAANVVSSVYPSRAGFVLQPSTVAVTGDVVAFHWVVNVEPAP